MVIPVHLNMSFRAVSQRSQFHVDMVPVALARIAFLDIHQVLRRSTTYLLYQKNASVFGSRRENARMGQSVSLCTCGKNAMEML